MAVLFQYYTAPTACLAPPPRPQIARLTNVLDEAAGRVVRVELLALQLDARRGRGVVGLEPLLGGAALVGKVVYLFASVMGRPQRMDYVERCGIEGEWSLCKTDR